MILDFHTHTFPEHIAGRAVRSLSESSHMPAFLDGTLHSLMHSMEENGIDRAVLLPVATAAKQQESINRTAIQINERWQETGILSFGGIHPDNDDYKEILSRLVRAGIRGIKLHPVFTEVALDDPRYLRIIDRANELGLIVLTHAGWDVSFPGRDYAAPFRIHRMLHQLKPQKMVLAHMGGWGCWEETEELLAEYPVYLDTAFTLTRPQYIDLPCPGWHSPWRDDQLQLDQDRFLRLVRIFGEDHILFGSDSPWSDQGDSVRLLRESGLKETALPKILFGNAARLLAL